MRNAEWQRTVALMRLDPGEMGAHPSNAGLLLFRLAAAQMQFLTQLRSVIGVTMSELHSLLALWDGGRCSMSELAERVDLSRAAMTTLADRIELAGYVERIPDPGDRRKVLLSVTPKFVSVLEKHTAGVAVAASATATGAEDWPAAARDIAAMRSTLLQGAAALREQAPRRAPNRTLPDVPPDNPSSYW